MIVALIPARGGSKRLPRKNVLPLNGVPLIGHSIKAALAAKAIDRVIVSTDDDEIAQVAKAQGAEVPFMRDAKLATDTASSNDVMLDLLARMPDITALVLLQPTSPLRTAQDIDNVIELLASSDQLEGVVSVTPTEHPISWSQPLGDDHNMGAFAVLHEGVSRQPTYRLNGAIYAFKRESLIANGGIRYSDAVKAYVMPNERSVDIDTLFDFKVAEALGAASHG